MSGQEQAVGVGVSGQEGAPPRGRARPAAGGPETGKQKSSPARHASRTAYPYALKRRAVQLCLEEGLRSDLVGRELGVPVTTVYGWLQRYRQHGEAALVNAKPGGAGTKLPAAVQAKIVELKRAEPRHGVRRISQILRRLFCLKASPETVRRHLKATGLTARPPHGRKKPTPAPRRFERATPNQLWQSDITTFPILGQPAYIIGFLDDYSRYVTGLGVYRSQPSAYVVETYRAAVAAHGTPKEMLTDNGRQYATWRGQTQFQKELAKDHVQHLRSAPQHPTTLGKIERF